MTYTTMTVDPQIIQALREILVDTDSTSQLYSEQRLIEALRVNRVTVRVRDPYLFTAGVYARHRYFAPVPVPWSDIPESLLQPEPGGASFQAAPFRRYWDPQQGSNIEVWLLGVKQVYNTDYTVDWLNGRVTFQNSPSITLPVDDWKPVQAGYSYYRIWHAARQVVAGQVATGREVQVRFGSRESVTLASPSEVLKLLDALIAEMSPTTVTWHRKTY